ncbi:MAG: hypothetical protein ACR2GR_09275 [Rhodothermales bacterium]
MNRSYVFALVLSCFLGGCATSSPTLSQRPVHSYENDDLVSMRHNQNTDYTVLVYRDSLGQLRQVVRKQGVCEMVITYTVTGDILLKERGEGPRRLQPSEADVLSHRIKTLLRRKPTPRPAAPRPKPSATV